ncbi:MAG: hypothetical protein ACFFD4_14940 [Candidatus Odinarchaeota archaeon]
MRIRSPVKYRKHYSVYFCSFVFLVVVFSSIPASTANTGSTGSNLDFNKASEISEEFLNPDRVSREVYDYFADQWNPKETTFNMESEDLTDIQDSFRSTFFDNWLNDPFYSQTKPVETKSYTSTVYQENSYSSTSYSCNDNCEIIERTKVTGCPRITLVEPDLTGIDNILVPVVPLAEAKSARSETYEKSYTIKMGIDFELPSFDKEIIVGNSIARFRTWARFLFRIRFVFPIKLVIQYPEEVIQGGSYSFKCTMIALDLPEYNEFDFHFKISFGVALEVFVPFGVNEWFEVISRKFYLDEQLYESYKTPLAGSSPNYAQINLQEIDILELIETYYFGSKDEDELNRWQKIVKNMIGWFSAGLGLGNLKYYGDGVTADLSIYTEKGKLSGRDVGWKSSGDTKTLNFRISEADHMKFSVSDLVYHIGRVTWNPYLFLRFKKADIGLMALGIIPKDWTWAKDWVITLQLDKWLGGLKYSLPSIPIASGWKIPSSFSYSSSNLPFIPDAVYDYSAKIQEITPVNEHERPASLKIHDQLYEIELQNLGGRTDTLFLEAVGLPTGYTATFNREFYNIGSSSPVAAILHVSPPKRVDVPPGPTTFSIKATSQTLKSVKHANSTNIITGVPLVVPEIVDIDFDLEYDQLMDIEVEPRSYFPIKFFGGNGGNQNDTILVNATLTLDTGTYTWEKTYPVDPWASGSGQYFIDQFGFYFDINDIFPPPGYYLFEIQATSLRNPNVTKQHSLTLYFPPVYGVEISISPSITTIFANWAENFTLTLRNTGNVPDNYTLISGGWDDYLIGFPRHVNNCQMLEIREIPIELLIPDPESVPADYFRFRIEAISENDNTAFDYYYVGTRILDPDKIPPGIVYIEPLFSTGSLIYPQSSLTLGPVWKAYDDYPDKYAIYFDSVLDSSGSWSSGDSIQVPVNQLPVGYYNLTITFNDTSGNIASKQVWINITDPDIEKAQITVNYSDLLLPRNFASNHCITWEIAEDYLFNITLYQDDSILPLTDYSIEISNNSGSVKCIIETGTLLEGIHNYTLLIQDMGNNNATSTVLVTITSDDAEEPVIDSRNTPSIPILSKGETISFNLTDLYPNQYELWINSSLEQKGTWESAEVITFQVDELNLIVGNNYIEFYAYDLSGNYYYYSWDLLLRDIDPPVLLVEPVDSIFFEHNLSQFYAPYWQLQDNDPRLGSYLLFQNSTLVEEGRWSSVNGTIHVPIGNLRPGVYIFEAEFRDATGNLIPVPSSVEITIKDITAPYILSMDDIDYEPLYTPNWFEWIITEPFPSSYQLYKNDSLIDEMPLSSNFTVVFVLIDMYDLGSYNYTIIVSDESGNIGKESILVKVTDFTPPLIKPPPDIIYSEGSEGPEIIWEIIEANPYNYSLYSNDRLIENGTITSMNLTTSVTGLELGNYLYLLIVQDEQGLSHACSCLVIVLDFTSPDISLVSDCRFVMGDLNAKITWQVDDLHPARYIVKLGEETIYDESWNGDEITMNLVGWSSGNYTIQLQVFDTSGNTATDRVNVEIVAEEDETNMVKPSPAFTLVLGLIGIVTVVGIKKRKKLS